MRRDKKLFWTYAALAFAGLFLLVLFNGPAARSFFGGTARAETARTSSWPAEIALPAGQKLVGVSWLCHAACEPWTATRPMRAGESAETYSFSNGAETIRVRETPPSR